MRPTLGVRNPVISANNVVLPAPFGPITAVMLPRSTVSDASRTASSPLNRLDMPSTAKIGSTMRGLPRLFGRPLQQPAQPRNNIGDAAWCKSDHQNQHDAVDHEIEARNVSGDVLGRLTEQFDHQRAEQR